jgi:hypothetical protein
MQQQQQQQQQQQMSMSAPAAAPAAAAPAAATGGFFESKGFFDEHLTHAYNEPICGCKADPCGFLVRALSPSVPTVFFNAVLPKTSPSARLATLNGGAGISPNMNMTSLQLHISFNKSSYHFKSTLLSFCTPTLPLSPDAFIFRTRTLGISTPPMLSSTSWHPRPIPLHTAPSATAARTDDVLCAVLSARRHACLHRAAPDAVD